MSALKFIIDCDPGHDDAAAILYAAAHLEVLGVTTVFGNQDLDKTTRNALAILELGRLEVPVARGLARPWVAEPQAIPETHGPSGLDGAELPEPSREPVPQSAVEFILEQAYQHRGQLVLVAVAPLTNIATALRAEPRLRQWLHGISIMGGSLSFGNVTPVAEFNIHADPEAAHAVLTAGVPLHLCGLNVTRQAGVLDEDLAYLRASGTRVGDIFAGLFSFYRQRLAAVFGLSSASLHDPCALAPFVQPGLVEYRCLHVEVALAAGPTRGMTVADLRYMGDADKRVEGGAGIVSGKPPNVRVATGVEARRLVRHVLETLCQYG
jgi:inosine-uridine nucleoside N-ribohydrolase